MFFICYFCFFELNQLSCFSLVILKHNSWLLLVRWYVGMLLLVWYSFVVVVGMTLIYILFIHMLMYMSRIDFSWRRNTFIRCKDQNCINSSEYNSDMVLVQNCRESRTDFIWKQDEADHRTIYKRGPAARQHFFNFSGNSEVKLQ